MEIILAYDHGIEHGYSDFSSQQKIIKSRDPSYVISLAHKLEISSIAISPGIFEMYKKEIKDANLEVILKVNAHVNIGEFKEIKKTFIIPYVFLLDDESVKGLGYTIYWGSSYLEEELEKYRRVKEDAIRKRLNMMIWAYPRWKGIKNDNTKELLSYAVRSSMEVGANKIKIKFPSNISELEEILSFKGKSKVYLAGGKKSKEIIEKMKKAIEYDIDGFVIGRNIWQDPKWGEKVLKEIKEFI